jgi:transposase
LVVGVKYGSSTQEEQATGRAKEKPLATAFEAVSQEQRLQAQLERLNWDAADLHHLVSDITGVTGLTIIRAILAGERDPRDLPRFRDRRSRQSEETLSNAMHGGWREEHLLALRQTVELYDFYQRQLAPCDAEIARVLARLAPATDQDAPLAVRVQKIDRNTPRIDGLCEQLVRVVGVDLTRRDGLNPHSVLKILSEIGTDRSRWPSAKHFCSWLGLSPGNKVSGGKRIGKAKTTPSANRAAAALRMAAQGLSDAHGTLGGYWRRQKARLGSPKAITATAHKLASILYSRIAYKTEYAPPEANYYDVQYRKRVLATLKRRADPLGFDLIKRLA